MNNQKQENKVQQVVVKRVPGSNKIIKTNFDAGLEAWTRIVNARCVYEVKYAR